MAEMHNAAEKARLRRLADEAERIAAQERARQKAKELEARLAGKAVVEKPAEVVQEKETRPPPGIPAAPAPPVQAQPQFTIAQRPKPVEPIQEARPAETSWRKAPTAAPAGVAAVPPPPAAPAAVRQPTVQPPPTASQVHAAYAAPVQNVVEPVVRLPGQPIQEEAQADGKFDDVLARIQASMAGTKVSPAADTAPAAAPAVTVPAAEPTPLTKGYFETTQLDPPRSPPPAWRTYTVRLPRPSAPLPPIPLARIRAAEAYAPPPKGWSQTFNPPLDSMDKTQSLIPRPLASRIQSVMNGGRPDITVSLPKGTLSKAKPKKEKKKAVERTEAESVPIVAVEALIEPPQPSPSWSDAPTRKKSPVKTSLAAKAERQGVFAQEAVGLPSMAPRRDSLPGGVRFMVSSELEGDSLLDEVNKMSLETVDEGMGDGAPKTPGSEVSYGMAMLIQTPKTPPAPRSTTQPSSPTGTWGRRHDHLKSVWAAPEPEKQETETPMYPSLNTPLEPTKTYESIDKPAYAERPSNAVANGWAGNPYTQQNYAVQGQLWSPSYGPSMSAPGYGFQQPPPGQTDKRRPSGDHFGQVPVVPAQAVQGFNGFYGQTPAQGFGAGYPYTPAQVNAYRQAQAAATSQAQPYGTSVSQAVMANGRRRFTPNGEHGPFANARYNHVPNPQIRHNAQQLLHQQQLAARQHAMQQQQQQQNTQGYFGGVSQKADGKH